MVCACIRKKINAVSDNCGISSVLRNGVYSLKLLAMKFSFVSSAIVFLSYYVNFDALPIKRTINELKFISLSKIIRWKVLCKLKRAALCSFL